MLWPFGSGTSDTLAGTTPTEQKLQQDKESEPQKETGWDRVIKIFKKE